MSDMFGITVSALQAFKNAIEVTGNNISNSATPGYSRQSINLTEAIPQGSASLTVGAGVQVVGISRAYSQAATDQLNTSQSALSQLTGLQSYTSQIDNLLGTTAGGVSTALTSFYTAWSNVANNPTSTASRQALLSSAQSLARTFQSTTSQLGALKTDINSRITADVTQINSLADSITALNKRIVTATNQSSGQAPNGLLDQRGQLVSQLSKLVGVTTTTASDGALNVFVGTGQPLVLEGQVNRLTTVPNQYDATQLDISTTFNKGNVLNGSLTAGELGGLLAARTQAIDPALNQLGQVATALSTSVNKQQTAGVDLSGNIGAAIFSAPTPTAVASSRNTSGVTASVSVTNVGTLSANDYVLSYKGGAYFLSNAADGSSVAMAGSGTAADPFRADGVSITLSGTPAANDSFLIKPTGQTASTLQAVLSDPSKIAAAGAVAATGASTNKGVTAATTTVVDPTNANLQTPATVVFTSPTTYSINGGAQVAFSGGTISANGWQMQLSGAPAAGDTFTVKANTGASGDNRNALASANQQTLGVLNNGTTSVAGAVSALVTGIGSQAQQVNTATAAQTAVNTQASNQVQSTSGVNLDEEAAKLLQWQQAYQAAAQALQIGNTLFTSLINAVNH